LLDSLHLERSVKMSFNINKLLDSAGEYLGLSGDPFVTPIGEKVLEATHESLNSVDWETNLVVVDMVNLSEDGPREAIRAIRKRMQTMVGKNDQVVYFSLVLLETLAKNCGRKFHLLICSRDFSNELFSKIVPASTNTQMVEIKVLSLIQSWAHAFSVDPELTGVAELYLELKKKGIEFPPPTDDDILLVEKTKYESTVSSSTSSSSSSQINTLSPSRQGGASPAAPANTGITLSRPTSRSSRGMSAEQQAREARRQEASRKIMAGQLSETQIQKLQHDIRKTEDSICVLSELLSEVIPGQEHPEDKQILENLAVNCTEMQKRVVALLQIMENRDLMQTLLDCNDSLNNVFIRYERYKRNQPPSEDEKQSLKLPVSPSRPSSSDAALLAAGHTDFQEMEEWMKTENLDELEAMRREFETDEAINPVKSSGDTPATSPDGETTEEFNKFLEKRFETPKSKDS